MAPKCSGSIARPAPAPGPPRLTTTPPPRPPPRGGGRQPERAREPPAAAQPARPPPAEPHVRWILDRFGLHREAPVVEVRAVVVHVVFGPQAPDQRQRLIE